MGHSSTKKVNERVLGNSILTTCEVLGISFGSVQSMLKDNLNMFQVAAKFIPCLLSEELTLVCVHVNLWLKNKMTVIPHPPYTLGLALCDIFLFPELKMVLNGGTFNDTSMVQAKLWGTLVTFQTVHFRKCF